MRLIVNPDGTNERFDRKNLSWTQLRVFPDNTKIFPEIAEDRSDVIVTDSFEILLQQRLDKNPCVVRPDQPFTHMENPYILLYENLKFKTRIDLWLQSKKS
ncbi:MAG: hypothetical protein ACMUEM_01970 [Flavobacteriales bacterium AspAUS03]